MSELMLDVGQAQELKLAFRRNGYTNEDIKRLSEGDILGRIYHFVRSPRVLNVMPHIIDSDVEPYTPKHFSVVEHRKYGLLDWKACKISFEPFEEQLKPPHVMKTQDIRERMSSYQGLNASILDYLLLYPHLMSSWSKHARTAFWGTIYEGSEEGGEYVRVLYYDDSLEKWRSLFCKISERSFNNYTQSPFFLDTKI